MRNIASFILSLGLAGPAAAHHSNAGLDMNSLVTIEGTVTELAWRNPHVYFSVETVSAGGERIEWTLQLGSTITTTRMGWTRDSLAVGERVTVSAHPELSGRPYGLLYSIEKEGGLVLPTAFDEGTAEPTVRQLEENAVATSLNGTWMARSS